LKRFTVILASVGFLGAAACRCFSPATGHALAGQILGFYVTGVFGVFAALHSIQTGGESRNRLLRFLRGPVSPALLALLLVLYLGALFDAEGAFFKADTHRDALRQVSVYGILACGMCLVIVTGGIDLSVGSVLGLVGVCFALIVMHSGLSPWAAVFWCLVIGGSCGVVSGTLTAVFRIQPFIATLAMMVFARGLAKTITENQTVPMMVLTPERTLYVPEIVRLINSRVLGDQVSMVTVIFLGCAAVTWLLLARHQWGRQLYAIGGNEEAAWLSGIPVRRAKIMAYGAAGVLAAIAGICHAAQATMGHPEAGSTYELSAIAIVVIGGTSLMGGRGGIGLTLIGALTIGYLEKILSINAVQEAWRLMLTGVIIVAAVLIQRRGR